MEKMKQEKNDQSQEKTDQMGTESIDDKKENLKMYFCTIGSSSTNGTIIKKSISKESIYKIENYSKDKKETKSDEDDEDEYEDDSSSSEDEDEKDGNVYKMAGPAPRQNSSRNVRKEPYQKQGQTKSVGNDIFEPVSGTSGNLMLASSPENSVALQAIVDGKKQKLSQYEICQKLTQLTHLPNFCGVFLKMNCEGCDAYTYAAAVNMKEVVLKLKEIFFSYFRPEDALALLQRVDTDGNTLIHEVAHIAGNDAVDTLEELLNMRYENKTVYDVYAVNKNGEHPIHYSMLKQEAKFPTEVIRLFHKLDPEILSKKDSNGKNILHIFIDTSNVRFNQCSNEQNAVESARTCLQFLLNFKIIRNICVLDRDNKQRIPFQHFEMVENMMASVWNAIYQLLDETTKQMEHSKKITDIADISLELKSASLGEAKEVPERGEGPGAVELGRSSVDPPDSPGVYEERKATNHQEGDCMTVGKPKRKPNYYAMKKKELEEECKRRSLTYSNQKKPQLVSKLLAASRGQLTLGRPSSSGSDGNETPQPTVSQPQTYQPGGQPYQQGASNQTYQPPIYQAGQSHPNQQAPPPYQAVQPHSNEKPPAGQGSPLPSGLTAAYQPPASQFQQPPGGHQPNSTQQVTSQSYQQVYSRHILPPYSAALGAAQTGPTALGAAHAGPTVPSLVRPPVPSFANLQGNQSVAYQFQLPSQTQPSTNQQFQPPSQAQPFGGFAGTQSDISRITSSGSDGTVRASMQNGGFAGTNIPGTTSSGSDGTVTSSGSDGTVTASMQNGGFAGTNIPGTTSSGSDGTVTARMQYGGFAGTNIPGTTSSGSDGTVTASMAYGGFAGTNIPGTTSSGSDGTVTASMHYGGFAGTNIPGTTSSGSDGNEVAGMSNNNVEFQLPPTGYSCLGSPIAMQPLPSLFPDLLFPDFSTNSTTLGSTFPSSILPSSTIGSSSDNATYLGPLENSSTPRSTLIPNTMVPVVSFFPSGAAPSFSSSTMTPFSNASLYYTCPYQFSTNGIQECSASFKSEKDVKHHMIQVHGSSAEPILVDASCLSADMLENKSTYPTTLTQRNIIRKQ